MQAHEYEPGRFVIFDVQDKPYALIDFVRRGGELGYRAVRWAQSQTDQTLIGYYKNLRAACAAVAQKKQSNLTVDVREASGWGTPPGPPVRPAQEVSAGRANSPARTERD